MYKSSECYQLFVLPVEVIISSIISSCGWSKVSCLFFWILWTWLCDRRQGGIIVAGPGKSNISYIHKDKEAGDDPDIDDILKACCSWRNRPEISFLGCTCIFVVLYKYRGLVLGRIIPHLIHCTYRLRRLGVKKLEILEHTTIWNICWAMNIRNDETIQYPQFSGNYIAL